MSKQRKASGPRAKAPPRRRAGPPALPAPGETDPSTEEAEDVSAPEAEPSFDGPEQQELEDLHDVSADETVADPDALDEKIGGELAAAEEPDAHEQGPSGQVTSHAEADTSDDELDAPSDDELEEVDLPGADSALRPGLEKARPGSVSEAHLKSVLESLIFVSDQPVPARRLARIARARTKDVERLVGELSEEYQQRGIQLVEIAGGFQFRSSAANAPFVREIVAAKPVRLSRAQLEALAIVAYRQPLTRPELEEIRGVDSGSALKVLLDRGLVKILGRKEEPGRPLLYGTTPAFLEFFGMSSLDQLPTLKEFSELSDESRALFARRTGEEIGTIGDIQVPQASWESEDDEGADAGSVDEGGDVAASEGDGASDEVEVAKSSGEADEEVRSEETSDSDDDEDGDEGSDDDDDEDEDED